MLINMQITLGNKSNFPFLKCNWENTCRLVIRTYSALVLRKGIICKAIILKQTGALKAHK